MTDQRVFRGATDLPELSPREVWRRVAVGSPVALLLFAVGVGIGSERISVLDAVSYLMIGAGAVAALLFAAFVAGEVLLHALGRSRR